MKAKSNEFIVTYELPDNASRQGMACESVIAGLLPSLVLPPHIASTDSKNHENS